MTFEIAAFLIIFVVGLVLFSAERTSPDVTALGLMLALILLGLLEPQEAFAGFGSETVLMILGLLILTESLTQNGLVDTLGRWLLSIMGKRANWLQITWLTAPAVMSAFISNTASTAFFYRLHSALPTAFASILLSY